jgi:5-methylthioadenosine/S-adenosylhomocysteine deaminase
MPDSSSGELLSPLAAEAAPTAPGDFVVTDLIVLAGDGTATTGSALAVVGGRLAAVGPTAAVLAAHPALRRVDGAGHLAVPGLVNAHTHAAMGFFRGLGHGHDQMIEKFLFPAEAKLTPELLEPLSWSYLVAGLKAGVTCVGDHYYFVEGVGRALDRMGLRGVLGETVADLGGAFPGRSSWERARAGIERWPHSARVRPAVAPHAADTVSASLLTELAVYAKQQRLPLHMHLSQTKGERERVLKREGVSPVAYAERCGALGERTLAVHLVATDADDARRLGASGATAGLCAASQVIYEQLAPVRALAEHGVPLALGTDCAASNDGSDLLAEMRIAALLLKDRGVPDAVASPDAVLAAATRNGARALAYDDQIGTLAPGKAADVVFLELDVGALPIARPATNLIYSLGARHVRHVLVDGRFVLLNGSLTLVDEKELRAEYLAAVREIDRRLGR